jgi:hypothetical protein
VVLNTNREKGTESGLLVLSQGSRAKVIKYLWLKFLWDELSRQEMRLFLSMPEVLNSELYFATLRAVQLIGKKEVRTRLIEAPFVDEKERPTRARYLGFKCLNVEIQEIDRRLPRVPKFSGWIRSASSIGSKRPRGSSLLDPLAIIENDYEEEVFDWFNYLTVGDITFHTPVGTVNTLNESRNVGQKRPKKLPLGSENFERFSPREQLDFRRKTFKFK